jgi:gliding motility-associated-like protein
LYYSTIIPAIIKRESRPGELRIMILTHNPASRSRLLAVAFSCFILNFAARAQSITCFAPVTGAPGTLVTISGKQLGQVSSLTIGGCKAILLSAADHELVAMVMPGATTGKIAISDTNTTAVSANAFTVTGTPYPQAQQGNKLSGADATGTANQGYSVSISADGNTAIVGGFKNNSYQGGAWIYTRKNGEWTQQGAKLLGSEAVGAAQQGVSVAMSADGNTAIVGGYYDRDLQGAAWIFIRNGNTWSQQGPKLTGTGNAGTGGQGYAVSLSADGNTAAIGAYLDQSSLGAAWVFTRTGTTWKQQGAKLVGTGAIGAAQQGRSVALSADGNTLAVGGFHDSFTKGAVWIYARKNGVWSQQGNKLVGSGASDESRQGFSVALSADGNTLISGGYYDNSLQGAAWIFTRSNGAWNQQGNKLVGAGGGSSNQGSSVSLSADGNTAIVGGYLDNYQTGAIWTYTRKNGTWEQTGNKLTGSGNYGGSGQGISAAISADGLTAISGGFMDAGGKGAAWIFTAPAPETPALTARSSNADLAELILSAGTLSPSFKPEVTHYSIILPGNADTLILSSKLADTTATLLLNGKPAADSEGFRVPVPIGNHELTITVTAGDGSVKNYILNVKREMIAQASHFDELPAKQYGDPDFNVQGFADSGLPVSYFSADTTVATISLSGKIQIRKAGKTLISMCQDGNGTYAAAQTVSQLLIVEKAPLTIAAADTSKAAGDLNPAFRLSYTGFLKEETPSVLAAVPAVSTTATTQSESGIYEITLSGGDADNYAITLKNGTLTVTGPKVLAAANDTAPADAAGTSEIPAPQAEPATPSTGLPPAEPATPDTPEAPVTTPAEPVAPATAAPAALEPAEPVVQSEPASAEPVEPSAPATPATTPTGLPPAEPATPVTPEAPVTTPTEPVAPATAAPAALEPAEPVVQSEPASAEPVEPSAPATPATFEEPVAPATAPEASSAEPAAPANEAPATTTTEPAPIINQTPTLASIADQVINYSTTKREIALEGIGPGAESAQAVTLSIRTDNPGLFSKLAVHGSDNKGIISYILKKAEGGVAQITVTVKDNGGILNGGIDSLVRTFSITVNPLPIITITCSQGTTVTAGTTVNLNASGGTSYSWSSDSSILIGQQTPVLTVRPLKTTTYTVTVTNATGGTAEQQITIYVTDPAPVVASLTGINNVLTPNGDGKNDVLSITGIDKYPVNSLRIVTRSGKEVYRAANYQNDWNGSDLPEDTYYYTISRGNGAQPLRGFVSIVRN